MLLLTWKLIFEIEDFLWNTKYYSFSTNTGNKASIY